MTTPHTGKDFDKWQTTGNHMSSQKQYTRSVQAMGPSTLGISLPSGFVNEFNVDTEYELQIDDIDWDEGTITYRV